ncbi:MAG: hypothetical protein EA349_01865 [Halomonadaceae bacterium]|nr:MAG: hypothetical protein EA349_01865 [Halomonadaceae bacterium]
MAKNPFYDPTRSHHRPGGFGNPPGNPLWHRPSAGLAAAWAGFARDMLRLRGLPAPFGPDHALGLAATLDGFHGGQHRRQATWLGHASFLLNLDGCHILTDPFLSDYASPAVKRLVPAALTGEQIPALDILLLSHNHYDHLDRATLTVLARRFPQTQVFVPLGLGPLLKRCGFTRVQELDWYDQQECLGIQVTAVPAIHMARRGLTDMNRTLWCGFALGHQQWQGYFAGDTAYGPVFREIGERLGPFDLALVPIGAYAPRRLMHCVHSTPEEALEIARLLQAKNAIAMHWGSIRLTTEPMDEPPRRFLADPSPQPRQLMAVGETTTI